MKYDDIVSRVADVTGRRPRPRGRGHDALCPAHDDRDPSLSIGTGSDGRVLLHCHAGCSTAEVVRALGLTMADLYDRDGGAAGAEPPGPRRSRPSVPRGYKPVDDYPYHSAEGTVLYVKRRFERLPGSSDRPRKTFRYYRPDPAGDGFVAGLDGVDERPLFRLPATLAAIQEGAPIAVVEGEKDAVRLDEAAWDATCNDGGAGKWGPEHTAALAGADVVVVADNDEAGIKHAESVCRALLGTAASVRLLRLDTLPDGSPMPPGGDVSDWLDAAADLEEVYGPSALGALLKEAPPFEGEAAADPSVSPGPVEGAGEEREGGAAPTGLPDELYDLLPGPIADACRAYTRPLERASFLVALLVALSAALPNVEFRYGRETLTPHLFGFLFGGPASGKGVVKVALGWVERIDSALARESARARAEWRSRRDERDRARKGRGEPPPDPGEEPPERFLLAGEDTTAAGLADALADNPHGVLMATTEADSLADANGRQHGAFSSVLRKGFHNERHSETRRGADRLVIMRVVLAVLLAGTLDQVRAIFTKGVVDGLYSRFALAALQPTQYESQMAASGDVEFDRTMEAGARAAEAVYDGLEGRSAPLPVVLPGTWWSQVDAAYAGLDGRLRRDAHEALTAIAKRGPVIVYRIAVVLAVWRAHSEGVDLRSAARLDVGGEEAEAALLLGLALSETSVRLAAEFGREFEADPGPLSEKARASLDDEAFDGLPDEFASLDVVEAYRVVGRSRATAYRRIESWRESGKVEGVPGSPGRYRKAS